jgi:hypothetical protein
LGRSTLAFCDDDINDEEEEIGCKGLHDKPGLAQSQIRCDQVWPRETLSTAHSVSSREKQLLYSLLQAHRSAIGGHLHH